MLVIGEADEQLGFKPGYQFAYIGATTDATENKIHILRTANALTRLGDSPISKQTLLEVIEECNQSVTRKFSKGMKEVREVKSKVVPKTDLDYYAIHLTCEDRRLSLQRMGEAYLALDLSKQTVGDIIMDMFDFMLGVSASMLDLDAAPKGKETKNLKWRIENSEGFKYARTVLLSRI